MIHHYTPLLSSINDLWNTFEMAGTSTYLMLVPQISTGLTNTCENELKIKCFPCLYVYHYYHYGHFTILFLLPLVANVIFLLYFGRFATNLKFWKCISLFLKFLLFQILLSNMCFPIFLITISSRLLDLMHSTSTNDNIIATTF